MIKQTLIVNESGLVREAIAKILLSCGVDKSTIACVELLDDAIEFSQLFPIDLVICSHDLGDETIEAFIAMLAKKNYLPVLILQNNYDTNIAVPKNALVLSPPFNQQTVLAALYSLTQQPVFKSLKDNDDVALTNICATTISATNALLNKAENRQSKPTVLVVDDETTNIDLVTENLRSGYRVMAAKSGKQALKILANDKFTIDVILLDIMMPEMDGFQACKAIKVQSELADIPIIFLSAKNDVADIKYGFEIGAVDYITKPLHGDILLARVNTHVRLRQNSQLLANQVCALVENSKLREEIEKITQHDLKGPLNNIIFESYNLKDRVAAASINRAVNNVVNMINNSLNLYKIEQGKYQLIPERLNLTTVVIDAINAVQLQSEEKNLVITKTGLNKEYLVYAETLLCLSIFNNLLKNSVEASPLTGEIDISLSEGVDTITFCITNQGVVPLNIRHILFEKYASSDLNKGSGLGTYSAKLMTEVQHGSICFDIINEQKTQFSIKLPKYK